MTISFSDGYPAQLRLDIRSLPFTVNGCLDADPTAVLVILIPPGYATPSTFTIFNTNCTIRPFVNIGLYEISYASSVVGGPATPTTQTGGYAVWYFFFLPFSSFFLLLSS